MPERRRFPRLPVQGKILGVLLQTDRPVRIREIGLGGFATETLDPVPLSVMHEVRLTAQDDRSAVVRAQSVYSWPSCTTEGVPCYVTGFELEPERRQESDPLVRMLIEQVTAVGLYKDRE